MRLASILLFSLAVGPVASANEEHFATTCHKAWPRAMDVMEELGFDIVGGGPGGPTVMRHLYNTKAWRNLSSRARGVAETHEGLLGTVHGLRPYEARVRYQSINLGGWREGTRSCIVEVEMDWIGLKRSFFTEGVERFQSRGVVERLIMGEIRRHIEESGILNRPHQELLDRQAAEEREKPPTQ